MPALRHDVARVLRWRQSFGLDSLLRRLQPPSGDPPMTDKHAVERVDTYVDSDATSIVCRCGFQAHMLTYLAAVRAYLDHEVAARVCGELLPDGPFTGLDAVIPR